MRKTIGLVMLWAALFGAWQVSGIDLPHFKVATPAYAQKTGPCWDNCNGMTFSGGVASAAPWTPATLGANLVAWWDISAAGSVFSDNGCSTPATNLSNVNCVLDQSGNSLTSTNVFLSAAGVYQASGLNSKPAALYTDGLSSALQSTATTSKMNGLSTGTFCIVATQAVVASGAGGGFAAYGSSPFSNTHQIVALSSTGTTLGQIAAFFNFSNPAPITVPTSPTPFDACMIVNGTTVTPYVNGVAGTPGTLSGFTTWVSNDIVWLVRDAWGGLFAEDFIANNALTTTPSNYHTYAHTKWGT